jgi:hypothetical protein
MELLSLLLSPLSAAMRFLLDAYRAAIGSYGPAIILLSATVRLLTFPINRMATAAEARDRGVRDAMEKDLREIRRTSKGRERFERIDALYQRHKYHPIQSMFRCFRCSCCFRSCWPRFSFCRAMRRWRASASFSYRTCSGPTGSSGRVASR